MEPIGTIARLQVQRSSLKLGQRPRRWFDPAPLLAVTALEVDESGVVGITESGERVMDVHNRDHPQSRYGSDNGLSLGFTSHYARMRARLGERASEWVAGENVIVRAEREFCAGDLPRSLAVETPQGPLRLEGVRAAEPCVEFSRYLLGYPSPPGDDVTLPDPRVAATLAFLRHGGRGYYATFAGPGGRAVLLPGQRLYAP